MRLIILFCSAFLKMISAAWFRNKWQVNDGRTVSDSVLGMLEIILSNWVSFKSGSPVNAIALCIGGMLNEIWKPERQQLAANYIENICTYQIHRICIALYIPKPSDSPYSRIRMHVVDAASSGRSVVCSCFVSLRGNCVSSFCHANFIIKFNHHISR